MSSVVIHPINARQKRNETIFFGSSGVSDEYSIDQNGIGNRGFATAGAPEQGLIAARLLV
jgi:hypothetical protein